MPVTLTSGNAAPRHIQQMKIYDMDNDKKDDLVYLTSGGELGILYGTDKPGIFDQKILDSTLGITLKQTTDTHGGAVTSSSVPQLQTIISQDAGKVISDDSTVSDKYIKQEVYYQENTRQAQNSPNFVLSSSTSHQASTLVPATNLNASLTVASVPDNTARTTPIPLTTYVRSQYASLHGFQIEKKYSTKRSILYPDDTIEVEISLKNTSAEPQSGVMYLDKISKIFARDNSTQYSVSIDGSREQKELESDDGDYDLRFQVGTIPAGGEAKIHYTLSVLPASYGEMIVGNLEKGTLGDDEWGDVGFKTGTTCGAEMMLWTSTAVREYISSNRPQTYTVPFPQGIEAKIKDTDNNGVPDSVENMSPAEAKKQYNELANPTKDKKSLVYADKTGERTFTIGLDRETERNIEKKMQEIADGLSCGFGGGSCMSFPINWAPLAPGNDPVVMGSPVGDGFIVNEGLPILSALTAINVPTTTGCYQIPVIWPISPFKYTGSCNFETAAG